MSAQPLALVATGMVTAVGDDAPSSCAAMRVRFNNHRATDFHDQDWEPIVASRAAVDAQLFGEGRVLEMAARAVRELRSRIDPALLAGAGWVICMPEPDRPGRPDDDAGFTRRLAQRLEMPVPALCMSLPLGRAAGLVALSIAQHWLDEKGLSHVLLVASDSLVDGEALAEFDAEEQLFTPANPHGFIPGEAAVALLVGKAAPEAPGARMIVYPPAMTVTDPQAIPAASRPDAPHPKPLPIDGQELAAAIELACAQAQCAPADVALRIADANGTDAGFKEQALAEARAFAPTEGGGNAPLPPLWLPAESLGEVGAAYGLAAIVWAWHAAHEGYAPGPTALVHATNAEGLRAAVVLRFNRPT